MPESRPDPGAAEIALGAGLAAVAGAVDVLAFARLGHAFASVVTGNLVVVGVSIGQADLTTFTHVSTAIAAYAAGIVLGSIAIRQAAGTKARWPPRSTVLCACELAGLLVLGGVWLATDAAPTGAAQYLALVAAALAMGLQSAAFRLVYVPGVTTTYFTGTLTGLLAGIVTAGRVNRPALYALLALLAGASASGLLVAHAATAAVALPVVLLVAVLVTGISRRRTLAGPIGPPGSSVGGWATSRSARRTGTTSSSADASGARATRAFRPLSRRNSSPS